MSRPDFLTLPPRTSKPRSAGLSHVLDKATPLPLLEIHLNHCGELVDIIKMGWGLGYFDRDVAARAALCSQHQVMLGTGGTFLEIAARQGRTEQFHAWALSQGVQAIEVSNGLGLMTRDRKHELVEKFAQDFTVYAETGSKDGKARAVPVEWADEMACDLSAGASRVIAEGRESGTVGLYHGDGTIRASIIDALAERIDPELIIFEAPQKSQQAWLIQHLGANVNLGNLELTGVASVESLRLGLRADTAAAVVNGELP